MIALGVARRRRSAPSAALWLAAVGFFVIVAARAEEGGLRIRVAFSGREAGRLMSFPAVTIPAGGQRRRGGRRLLRPLPLLGLPGHRGQTRSSGWSTSPTVERVPASAVAVTPVGQIAIHQPSLVIDQHQDVADLLERPAFQRNRAGDRPHAGRRGGDHLDHGRAAGDAGARPRHGGGVTESPAVDRGACRWRSIAEMEILVVEDEAGIADFLARGLEAEGYGVTVAADGVSGERLALDPHTDLVVLDRMLPGRDGIEVLAAIRRAKPALPVILLTAKADVADRVEGFDLGATDYVIKPFAFDELLARIRARLRESDDASETTLDVAGIRLDLLTREATRASHAVRLPDREAELLAYLMRHAGRVCTREEILSAVWDYDHDPGTNVVQVYIGYLRRKLGLPGSPLPIETVRSVGYRLSDRE